jgi:hypothetical protein
MANNQGAISPFVGGGFGIASDHVLVCASIAILGFLVFILAQGEADVLLVVFVSWNSVAIG